MVPVTVPGEVGVNASLIVKFPLVAIFTIPFINALTYCVVPVAIVMVLSDGNVVVPVLSTADVAAALVITVVLAE